MRSRILLFITLLSLAVLSQTASAQWVQTSGPNGGQFSSFVKTNNGWLGMIGQGLYRYDNGRWTEIEPEWYGQLFRAGTTTLSAHVTQAKVSTDDGITWTQTTIPSDLVIVVGGRFISTSDDSIYRSSDGMNWEFYARMPESAFGLVQHKGQLYTQVGFNGLMRSSDMGVTWSTLQNQPPFGLAMEWFSSDDALFATPYPSSVFRTTDEGVTWEEINYNLYEGTVFDGIAAHGEDVFISDWNTTYKLVNKQWVEVPIAKIHDAKTIDGKIYMATNAGLVEYAEGTVRPIDQGIVSQNVTALGSVGPSLLARTNAGLYRTQDMGEQWRLISTMHAMDMATARGAIVVRGTSIMRSSDHGDTWENLDAILEDFVVYPTDLISYNDDLYLASGLVSAGEHGSGAGWTTGGIYRSTDGGVSWRDISGTLPEKMWTTVPVYTVAAANGKIVLLTADGMFAAAAGSSSWHRVNMPGSSSLRELYSTGEKFMMLADSTFYVSSDGENWGELVAQAPADFLRNYESVTSFSAIRRIPYITTSRYEMIEPKIWRTINRNFKLENNAWIEIRSTLPQETVTSPLIEHQGELYAGTSTLGVWKMALPASVAANSDTKSIEIYPNPTHDFVKLPSGSKSVSIYNTLGQDITTQVKLDGSTLDVRALPAGVYHLVVDGRSASFVKQ